MGKTSERCRWCEVIAYIIILVAAFSLSQGKLTAKLMVRSEISAFCVVPKPSPSVVKKSDCNASLHWKNVAEYSFQEMIRGIVSEMKYF